MSLTEICRLAEKAHEGQIDPDGSPHFAHVRRVTDAVNGTEETSVALLHDVLEDTDLRADELRTLGIPVAVVDAVELLTRDKQTPYDIYIDRMANARGHCRQACTHGQDR